MRRGAVVGLLLSAAMLAGLLPATATEAAAVPPHERYDEARVLMQERRFIEAAKLYRNVAESDEAPPALRAQALFACGLMEENARNYEQAAMIYREVQERFPESPFAMQAEQTLKALERAGGEWIEFRRRHDAAWDALLPAQARADQEGLRAARPELEHAAELFAALLRDFPDHPKARDVALTLGNVRTTLGQFGAAIVAYERALALAQREQEQHSGPGAESMILNAREVLEEAVRMQRRQWYTQAAGGVLVLIVLALVAVRPWQVADRSLLRLGGTMGVATLVLALIAMVAAYGVLHFVDDHSPIESTAAGLLVALPGLTGIVSALGFAVGLRRQLRWHERSATGVAAALGALAAVAVATCVVNAYALFPVLDSKL